MRLPQALSTAEGACNAKHLHLYFRRGTVFVGTCKLPIADIVQALMSQARRAILLFCPMD